MKYNLKISLFKKIELGELAIKIANKTINYNNKNNNYDIKLLSDRPIKKEKNLVRNKLTKINLSNIGPKLNEYNPINLKLSEGKRNIEKEELSKINSMKIFGKLMKGNQFKNISITNGIIENGNNNIHNFKSNSIFKNIKNYHHVNKFKSKFDNILNSDKINEPKDSFKKISILGLNRAQSDIFFKKTTLNDFELLRLNSNKAKKNSDIFIYTKHYGDHSKCPLCQSMEMKAKFTENKMGLHKRYNKHEIDDNKLDNKLTTNISIIKTRRFPLIKSFEEKKNNNDFSFKKELSFVDVNMNNNRYYQNTKGQFAFNVLKSKGKNEKLGINDFPVLDGYFNS